MTGKKLHSDLVVKDLMDQLIREDELRRTLRKSEGKGRTSNPERNRLLYTINNNKQYSQYSGKSKTTKKTRNCYNCGKADHYENECKRVKSELRQPNPSKEFVGSCHNNNKAIPRLCIFQESSGFATMKKSNDKTKWLLVS
jgi:hypothetical protein